MNFDFWGQSFYQSFNQCFRSALLRISKIKLVQVAFDGFAGSTAQNVFFGWLGNTVNHLRIHKAGIIFPDFFVIRAQIGVGYAFAKGFKKKLQHILSIIVFIGVMQKSIDAVVFVLFRQFGQVVFKRILHKAFLMQNAVGTANLGNIVFQQAVHKI